MGAQVGFVTEIIFDAANKVTGTLSTPIVTTNQCFFAIGKVFDVTQQGFSAVKKTCFAMAKVAAMTE